MAGPTELSGVVPGVVPGARGGDVAGAVNTATSSIMKMMTTMVQMQESKKQMAGQNLEKMMKMAEAGFPIDPAAITKTAKQAGMPIMKGEDMKALVKRLIKTSFTLEMKIFQ